MSIKATKINSFHFKFVLLTIIYKIIRTDYCSIYTPLMMYNQCTIQYCSKEQFESKECQINNPIIKTQWLNNIITIGNILFRYINFASYSNGDMVVESTQYPQNAYRMFYGIKRNGRPLFIDETTNGETPYYTKQVTGQTNGHSGKTEAIADIIKFSEEVDGKEYFFSISKLDCYGEIFDFENNLMYQKSVKSSTKYTYTITYRHAFVPYKTMSQSSYFYLFGFIKSDNPTIFDNSTFVLHKIRFRNNANFPNRNKEISMPNAYGYIVSCFQTEKEIFICFYLTKLEDKYYYNLLKVKEDLSNNVTYSFESTLTSDIDLNFYKCVHLKDEVGVFLYYDYVGSALYPIFLFKEFDSAKNKFIDYLPFPDYTNSSIELKKNALINDVSMNDIISVNGNKIYFCASVQEKEMIYIALLNVFGNKQVKIRLYSILAFSLYRYKILYELRIHNYNGFIAFSSSYCPNSKCDSNDDEHYPGLIIFSYPNSTDREFYLEEELFDNNKNLNDYEIDLKKELIFQNNLFGLILSSTIIENVRECGEYKLISSKDETREIESGSILGLDENIKLKFVGSGNIYPAISCKIEYYFNATEPEFNVFDNYPEILLGENDSNYFETYQYAGRLTYFNITLNRALTSDCDSNCSLCLEDQKNFCIVCKYKYIMENNNSSKICFDREISTTDLITEMTTENQNYALTNKLTNEETDQVTEKITDNFISNKITNEVTSITEKLNDKKSDMITNEYIKETEMITNKLTVNRDEGELITNKLTDEETEKKTEKLKDLNTELITNKKEEQLTEKYNEEITNKKTEKIIEKNSYEITESIIENNKKTNEMINVISNKMTVKVEEKITEIINTIDNTEELETEEITCLNEDILNNKCQNGTATKGQITEIYNYIKDNYIKNKTKSKNLYILTENTFFQLSSLNNQTISNDDNNKRGISIVDLGECTKILKTTYSIPEEEDLIIFKNEIKTQDNSQTYVQYEIYNPLNLEYLNLSVCEGSKISISSSVNLDSKTMTLYESLKESGYDLFDENDPFYTDICSTYTTENGTDITLRDRKKEIYEVSGNRSLCQSGCEIINFNSESQIVKCSCSPQVNQIEASFSFSNEKFTKEMIIYGALNALKYSNFLVLKCYENVFKLDSLKKNYGSMFMTFMLIQSFIFLFVYIFKDYKSVDIYLLSIINNKINNKNTKNHQNNKKINIKQKFTEKKKKKNNHKIDNSSRDIFKLEKVKDKINHLNNKNKKSAPTKKKNAHNHKKKDKNNSVITSPHKENISTKLLLKKSLQKKNQLKNSLNNKNINLIKINNININKIYKKNGKSKGKLNTEASHEKISFKKEKKIKHINKSTFSAKNNINLSSHFSIKNNLKSKLLINNNLNDQELNNLRYKDAIILDKRTYLQYYWSLLKKKQLILFTFFPAHDYNLFSLKICLFIVTFSLYLSINCLFFDDRTMHNIYKNNGRNDIIFRIPSILYSSLISSIVKIILKQLSLSEQNFLVFKKENNIKELRKKSKDVKRCLKIKLILFFFVNYLLLFLFWHFISCFCTIFVNTQLILICDSVISFCLSMLYPFLINLLPGIIRYPSLRAKNKDKECLYRTSVIIALI